MDRTGTGRHSRRLQALALTHAILVGSLAAPAMAAPEPRTKLVRCGAQSCLRVVGHRADPASIVRINNRAVAVEGARRWKVYLPVETVRNWSAPNARTIKVSLDAMDGRQETAVNVDLPIGLLAREINLASLVVSVR